VPVEGMYLKCIVIACNSGGPLESIVDGETGFLLPPDEAQWGSKVGEILGGGVQLEKMHSEGVERVKQLFSE